MVEDETDIGPLIVRALQRASGELDVHWSRDGVEALLEVGKRPPDLIVLDVAMPLVDGQRVLATLRSDPDTRSIKVIGMTGQRLPPDRLDNFRKNSHAFFLKPFQMSDLVAKALELAEVALASSKTKAAAVR